MERGRFGMKYVIPLILLILLIRYLFKNKTRKPTRAMGPEPEVLKQDPVCGAYVAQHRDLSLSTEDGVVYFCSRACMEKFRELRR